MGVAKEVFDAVESHAAASALFDRVNTVEPKSAPGSGLSCAIWLQNMAPAEGGSGLDQTSVRMELSVRLYSNMLQEPGDMIDPRLTAAAIELMEDYSGDFQLSNVTAEDIRAIDLLGMHGEPMQSTAGYLQIDKKMFRVITITLPVIINDLLAQAP